MDTDCRRCVTHSNAIFQQTHRNNNNKKPICKQQHRNSRTCKLPSKTPRKTSQKNSPLSLSVFISDYFHLTHSPTLASHAHFTCTPRSISRTAHRAAPTHNMRIKCVILCACTTATVPNPAQPVSASQTPDGATARRRAPSPASSAPPLTWQFIVCDFYLHYY